MYADATPEEFGREVPGTPREVTVADVVAYHRDENAAERTTNGMPLQVRVGRYIHEGRPCIVLRLLNGDHPKLAAQTIPLSVLTADQLAADLNEAVRPFFSDEIDLAMDDEGRDNWTDGELLPVHTD